MVKMIFPKLETHTLLVCQLDSTPLVERINVLHFSHSFGNVHTYIDWVIL